MHAHEYDYWLASKVYTDPTPLRPQTHLDAGCTSCIIFVLARVAQGATLGLSRFSGIVLARLAIVRNAALFASLRLVLACVAQGARRLLPLRRVLADGARRARLGNNRAAREILSCNACVPYARRLAGLRLVRAYGAGGARYFAGLPLVHAGHTLRGGVGGTRTGWRKRERGRSRGREGS